MTFRQWLPCLLSLGLSAAASAQAPPAGPPPAAPPIYGERQYPNGITGLMDVTYQTVRGARPLKLDLYYAAADQRARPAVIYVHGGGWAAGQPRAQVLASWGSFDKVLASVAARGYVTLGISYRLSGEARFPAQIHDVKAAVRWVRANAARYHIDPARIAIWGESAGGQLATLAGTSCGVKELEGSSGNLEQSSCVQAVVSWYSITDISTIEAQAGPGHTPAHGAPDGALSAYLGCTLASCDPAVVRQASPVAFASADDPPFLIMHGDADTTVPPEQSRELHEALRAKGVSSQLIMIPGVSHIWRGATDAQGTEIMTAVQKFLDEKLGVTPPKN